MKKKQLSEDLRRMQELAGIITEAVDTQTKVDDTKDVEDALLNLFKGPMAAASKTIKPSPKDSDVQTEGVLTAIAAVVGAPGLIDLLGKSANFLGKQFTGSDQNVIGVGLQKAGRKLEHKYIDGIAYMVKKAYPKKYGDQDPHDKSTDLYKTVHLIYAALLGGAAVASGIEAGKAVNIAIKGLEAGAAGFKTTEVVQLIQKIMPNIKLAEAKSNDYYKKGMMPQNEGEAYGGYEDIMPKQRLAILQKLLAASEKDLQVAPGPKTQEVIDHLKQAIKVLKSLGV